MKAWLIAGLLAVSALVPVVVGFYYFKGSAEQPLAIVQFESERHIKKLEPGAEFGVRSCKVLDGFRFHILLEGGKSIEGHLASAAKEEAGSVVIDMLNQAGSPPPTVKLLRYVEGYWIVDFQFTVDGKRSNMVELLKMKGLLL